MSDKKNKYKILYLSFNKDKSCLSLGMQKGYRIYDLSKKDSLYYYERIFGKGIGIIEMLEKTNILGLVGGGNDPFESANRVLIYDDKEGKVIANFGFKSNVLNIRLKRDRMLVICENFIYLITFSNFKSIDSIDLGTEKRAKIGFSFTLDTLINKLAYNINNTVDNKIIINTYDGENRKTSIELKTNYQKNNLIEFMEFNKTGQLLVVTAKHTENLELYNTETGNIICKCNIEKDGSNIKYISFSKEDDFICCCLNFGEFVIFNLKSVLNINIPEEEELQNLNNNKNKIIKLKIWSRFYLPEKKAICTFSNFLEDEQEKEYITCIGIKGNYYLVKFNKDKSDTLAEKVCEKYFLKSDS
jgi:hypothetical protein